MNYPPTTTMDVRKRSQATQNFNEKAMDLLQEAPRTDPRRWRLQNIKGSQTWHYLETDAECQKWPMSAADKYYLGLDGVRVFPVS